MVPTRRLWMYQRELPKLEAARALTQYTAVAAAFGSMDEQGRKNYLNQLAVTASGGTQRAPKATAAGLAALGIAVEEV